MKSVRCWDPTAASSFRRQDELITRQPTFALFALDFLEHHGEILNIVVDARVILEEQPRDELAMIGMIDDEVDVAGDTARIPGEYGDEIEGSTIVRGQLGAPAIRFVRAVPVRVNDPDARSNNRLSTGVQNPCPEEQRLAFVAVSPQRRVGHPRREIVGAQARPASRLPPVAGVRQGIESQDEDSDHERSDNSSGPAHG